MNLGAKYGKIDVGQVLPGRNLVAKETSERAEAVREKLREELSGQPFIAASTDLWTEDKTSTSYNTVNVNYIDENWELRSRVIGTKPLADRHTGANLYSAMRSNLEAAGCWDDHGDNVVYVTDNAANNRVAFQGRGRGWQSCFCHNLNLIVQDAVRDTAELTPIIAAAKKLVRFSKKTTINSKLKARDPNGRGLKSAVPTRWNSEYIMLESIVHSYPALTTMAGVADREEVIRHMEELEKEELEAVVSLLGFFDDASKQLSASKQPTSFLVPLLVEQSRRHLQPDAADRPLVKKLKVRLLRGILGDKLGGKVGDSHHLALALHPRYRRLAQLTHLDEETRSRIQELAKTEAAALFIRRAKSKTQSAVEGDSTAPTPSTSTSAAAAAAAPFSLELESEDEDDPDEAAAGRLLLEDRAKLSVDHEFAIYTMDKSGKSVKSGKELLDYWKQNEQRLPTLAALARKVHSTPASSAKAERTFSEAGRIVEKRRTRLGPSRVDDLLIIRDSKDLLQ